MDTRLARMSLVFFLFLGLFTSPVRSQTKVKPGFNLFSAEQDIEIGKQSAQEVEKQLPVLKDSTVQTYVARIGDRLAKVVQGPEYPYQFKVINVSDVNAFALPDGFMYVNRGLIEAAKSEAELAGVMAHEISHVAIRHGTNQASKAYMAQAGLGVLGGVLGGSATGDIIGAVGGFGLNTVFLKFGRQAEEQADVVGAQTLARAGYDPLAMADFFETLREMSGRDPGRFQTFFSSHPAPGNRAARIEEEVQLLGPTQKRRDVGSFYRIKAHLDRLPDAPSMQALAGAPTDSAPESGSGRSPDPAPDQVEAPSGQMQLFEQREGAFRIRYPSNWSSYESENDWSTTLAPAGRVQKGADGESQIVYGVLVSHFKPPDGSSRDADEGTSAPFRGKGALERSGNALVEALLQGNDYLRPMARSAGEQLVDGERALSLKLSGRSPTTGEIERVTLVLRPLPNAELVFLVLVAPVKRSTEVERLLKPMLSSLSVNDRAIAGPSR